MQFKEKTPFFPKGEIELSEKPDFLIRSGNDLIGIEHTEIFCPGPSHGGSIQAQESLQQRIIEHAKELYLEESPQNLQVRVIFQPGNKIDKKEIANIAQSLFELIKQSVPACEKSVILEPTFETWEVFPKGIASVHVHHNLTGANSLWDFVSMGFVSTITENDLQIIISKKGVKLRKYKENYSEIWLLITAADIRIASAVELSSQAATHCYETNFDRVFVFWCFSGSFIELNKASL